MSEEDAYGAHMGLRVRYPKRIVVIGIQRALLCGQTPKGDRSAPADTGATTMSSLGEGVYSRRMPRMQVYLPDDLYRAVKEQGLPASDLLQQAVRAELRRQELLAETDRYLDELAAKVGEPGPAAKRRAEGLSKRIRRHSAGSRAS